MIARYMPFCLITANSSTGFNSAETEQRELQFLHIYCSDVCSHSAAPESNKQNPRDRTLDLPIFFRYKHVTSLKNLPSPTPNESLPYWFQGNFAALSVLNFCLREFLLSADANRFELRCEPKRLMLLYYKICPCFLLIDSRNLEELGKILVCCKTRMADYLQKQQGIIIFISLYWIW